MIINTESTVSYNNKLKQTVAGMKLGVNSGTKKSGVKTMGGGPSKINPPNSHPSNPIHAAASPQQHKAAQAADSKSRARPQPASASTSESSVSAPLGKDKTLQHEINKTAVIMEVVGLAALLLITWR